MSPALPAIVALPRPADAASRPRRGVVLLAAALVALCVPVHPGRAAAAPVAWGMNPGAEVIDGSLGPADDAGLTAIRGVGTTELRVAASWAAADPSGAASWSVRGTAFDWTSLDSIARGAARHGMRWAPFLCYPPHALSRAPAAICGGPPIANAPAARFAAAFVRRYGPGGAFWRANPSLPYLPVREVEAWNEPNLTGVWPVAQGTVAADDYAAFYAAIRAAVRSASPGVDTVFASLSPVPQNLDGVAGYQWPSFLRRSVLALRGGPVDAFGWHPYINGVTRADPTAHVYSLVRAFRQELRRLGRGSAPMDLTEVGIARSYDFLGTDARLPESRVTFTEAERAAFYRAVVPTLAGSDCGIRSISPLQFSSDRDVWAMPPPGSDPYEVARHIATVFGLADAGGTLRESGRAYRDAVASSARRPAHNRMCGDL